MMHPSMRILSVISEALGYYLQEILYVKNYNGNWVAPGSKSRNSWGFVILRSNYWNMNLKLLGLMSIAYVVGGEGYIFPLHAHECLRKFVGEFLRRPGLGNGATLISPEAVRKSNYRKGLRGTSRVNERRRTGIRSGPSVFIASLTDGQYRLLGIADADLGSSIAVDCHLRRASVDDVAVSTRRHPCQERKSHSREF